MSRCNTCPNCRFVASDRAHYQIVLSGNPDFSPDIKEYIKKLLKDMDQALVCFKVQEQAYKEHLQDQGEEMMAEVMR